MLNKEYIDHFMSLGEEYDRIYKKVKERAIEIGLELKLISQKDSKNDNSITIDETKVIVNYDYFAGEWDNDSYNFPIEYLWSYDLVELEKKRKIELEKEKEKKAIEDKNKQEEIDKISRYELWKKLCLEFDPLFSSNNNEED